MRSVKWDQDPWDGLHTAAGVILDDGRYLVVSNFTGINSLAGPYTELGDLDRKLSCGKKILAQNGVRIILPVITDTKRINIQSILFW